MKKRERFSPPAVGASALLTAFAVLVLCVFALLSVSSVQAEARLSGASAENAAAYYAADLQAEEIFARLRSGQLPPEVECSENRYFYICPITTGQQLEVTLSLEDGTWEILQWQAVAGDIPPSDDTLQVWNGNIP